MSNSFAGSSMDTRRLSHISEKIPKNLSRMSPAPSPVHWARVQSRCSPKHFHTANFARPTGKLADVR